MEAFNTLDNATTLWSQEEAALAAEKAKEEIGFSPEEERAMLQAYERAEPTRRTGLEPLVRPNSSASEGMGAHSKVVYRRRPPPSIDANAMLALARSHVARLEAQIDGDQGSSSDVTRAQAQHMGMLQVVDPEVIAELETAVGIRRNDEKTKDAPVVDAPRAKTHFDSATVKEMKQEESAALRELLYGEPEPEPTPDALEGSTEAEAETEAEVAVEAPAAQPDTPVPQTAPVQEKESVEDTEKEKEEEVPAAEETQVDDDDDDDDDDPLFNAAMRLRNSGVRSGAL